jgi:hypothetical protein
VRSKDILKLWQQSIEPTDSKDTLPQQCFPFEEQRRKRVSCLCEGEPVLHKEMHNTENRDSEYILSELFCVKRLEATLYDRTIIEAEDNHFLAQLVDQELSVVSWTD